MRSVRSWQESLIVLSAAWAATASVGRADDFSEHPPVAIHAGTVPDLRRDPGLQAVVKLDAKFSSFDYGNCTGTFISDRHVVTAAHCFTHETGDPCFDHGGCTPLAQSVTVSMPTPEGYLYEIGTTTEFWMSDKDMDIAVVRLPKGTFKGKPAAYRFFSDDLKNELDGMTGGYITYGFGLTETGQDSRLLMSSAIPKLELKESEFSSNDAFRVDHGDSGGPVMTLGSGTRAKIVAVNHAYFPNDPRQQLFKPLRREFFEGLLADGVNVPQIACRCVNKTAFQKVARRTGDTATEFSDAGLPRLVVKKKWEESAKTSFVVLQGLVDEPCAEHVTEGAVAWTAAEGDPAAMIRQASTGVKCEARQFLNDPVP